MHNIEGRADIVKDPNSGAVININSEGHKAAIAGSLAREKAKHQIDINTNEINSIKEELGDIKNMLSKFIGSFSNDGK
jgi:hypothetical protein